MQVLQPLPNSHPASTAVLLGTPGPSHLGEASPGILVGRPAGTGELLPTPGRGATQSPLGSRGPAASRAC